MSVTLHTTLGSIKLDLFCTQCPQTCTNFLALAASSYYDNVPIHRSIPGFLFQSGDGVLRTGKHPGRSYLGENQFIPDEIHPALRHDKRGVLAMANRKEGENLSQFYVTYGEQKHLDGKNTVFGRVVDGWDVLEKMEKMDVDKKGRFKGKKVFIERITIHANPIADAEEGD
ncbi:cyclophilin-like protein [Ascodesmis nigricans]|uniref:Peptidyl-prolyl cis-trans isomerase n=1 Tax=Ascodesmis nigricans TaxID=341454 RepID=A0A4S2N2L4_9PEZI|nr:cyclophilin-like protein [Ascodesmis nigricans]